jgi:ribulose 1,5-bisphosphate synthetase/thiazole synthase
MTYSTITNEIPSGATSGDPGRPKVLIVGAGLAGLTLGMILQQSDIPYEIFESAPAIKPVGKILVLCLLF